MLCEKCAREVGSAVCGGCGKTIDLLGPFCYLCGFRLVLEAGNEHGCRRKQPGSRFFSQAPLQRRDVYRRHQRAGDLQGLREAVHARIVGAA